MVAPPITGIEVGAVATVIVKFPEPVTPAAFLTERAAVDGPAVVGVPSIKPLVGLILSPSGRLVAP